MEDTLRVAIERWAGGTSHLTVLTGAGISAESGIPTFRGPEGYWTVGSQVYRPQEMATLAMFERQPEAVWDWYLHRLGVCLRAHPNAGHRALVAIEALFPGRFALITQNVDNLHLRAGSDPAVTYQIHGNLFYMRCARACRPAVFPVPPHLARPAAQSTLTAADRSLLICPHCRGPARPHVLWFDEAYNEVHYRSHSALRAATRTGLLIVVGTSGATSLPQRIALDVLRAGGTLLDINIAETPFTALARRSPDGGFIQAPSAEALERLAAAFARAHPPAA